MGAQNYFKGKFHEGTFAGGQGPVHGIEIKKEEETKGVLGGSDRKKNLGIAGGQNDGLMGRTEDKGFDLYSAPYKGPQNMTPKDMGEVHNFNINK